MDDHERRAVSRTDAGGGYPGFGCGSEKLKEISI